MCASVASKNSIRRSGSWKPTSRRGNSLFLEKSSLIRVWKFPVPLRRTLLDEACESRVDIAFAVGRQDKGFDPGRARCGLQSLIWDSEVGFPGLVRKPITLALGTSSHITPDRFAPSVLTTNVTPVTLPPGRLRLGTRPRSTGSAPVGKITGMVVVAALAATAAGAMLGRRRARSRASRRPGERARCPAPGGGRAQAFSAALRDLKAAVTERWQAEEHLRRLYHEREIYRAGQVERNRDQLLH